MHATARRVLAGTVFMLGPTVAGTAFAQTTILDIDFEDGLLRACCGYIRGSAEPLPFFVTSGSTGRLTGLPNAGPASGAHFALLDSRGPGSYMFLAFVQPESPAVNVRLSFDLFVNNWAPQTIIGPLDPEPTTPGSFTAGPAQYARVNVARTVPGVANVSVAEIFLGGTLVSGNQPNPWIRYEVELPRRIEAGELYSIYWAVVNNQGPLVLGLDNVRVTAHLLPEPSTWAMLGTGLLGLGGVAVRRRRRTE